MSYTEITDNSIANPIGLKYAILPIDEEVFEIDANTRRIKVPESFEKNGIAVQGDQVAEVVYFKIARYFDFMDLNNTIIYIQYELADGTQEASLEWVRDIESEPDYLIFGWALDSRITKVSGKVKFSIRFVNLDDPQDTNLPDNIPYTYSLNTLETTVSVQPTLVLKEGIAHNEVTKAMEKIKHMITSRVKEAVQVGGEDPKKPHITMSIAQWLIENNIEPVQEKGAYVVDLIRTVDDQGKEKYVLNPRIQAVSQDTGVITYNWNELPENSVPTPLSTVGEVYERTTDDTAQNNTIYYKKSSTSGKFEIVTTLTSQNEIIPLEMVNEFYIDKNGNLLKEQDGNYYIYDEGKGEITNIQSTPVKAYYEKYGEATINKAGLYEGFASNTIAIGKSATVSGGKLLVPGPKASTVTYDSNTGFYEKVMENDKISGYKYVINATISNDSILKNQEFITESASCEYQWYKDGESHGDIKTLTSDDLIIENEKTVAKVSLAINVSETKPINEQGNYGLKIIAKRNNLNHTDEVGSLGSVSVTYEPTVLKKENITIQNEENNNYFYTTDTLTAKVQGLTNQLESKTKLTYSWYGVVDPGNMSNNRPIAENCDTNKINLSEHTIGNDIRAIVCGVKNIYNGKENEIVSSEPYNLYVKVVTTD